MIRLWLYLDGNDLSAEPYVTHFVSFACLYACLLAHLFMRTWHEQTLFFGYLIGVDAFSICLHNGALTCLPAQEMPSPSDDVAV